MSQVYLFDWGDTLMVDFPGSQGKMCNWEVVRAVEGAEEALAHLSRRSQLHIATSAADSTVEDIERALARVGLSRYITGYFCQANLGMSKSSPGFYDAIVERLGVDAASVTMVGDSFEKDIAPALGAGLNAIWLHAGEELPPDFEGATKISDLRQLCE